jgi:transposase
VRAGASVTDAARQAGVTRVTVHRWLKGFDPERPVVTSRPQQRGPRGPRWAPAVLDTVIRIIRDYPDLWGCRRVTLALAERGITVSERTLSRILPVARARIVQEQEAARAAAQARRSRQVAAMIRREEREEERRIRVAKHLLDEVLVPGIDAMQALARLAEAFAAKGWKFETKDLTPELAEIADRYLQMVRIHSSTYLGDNERWLLETDRWLDPDHARVAAINHLVKRWKAAKHALHDDATPPPMPGRKPRPALRIVPPEGDNE